MGKDNLVSCPYQSSHRVLQSKFQYHLVKCKKYNNSANMISCPLNNTHILDSKNMEEHIISCPNLLDMVQTKDEADINTIPNINIDVPKSCENWDEEPEPVSSYNPMESTENKNILRCMIGLSRSEKKRFKEYERLRMADLDRISTSEPDMELSSSHPSRDIVQTLFHDIKTQNDSSKSTQIHELNANTSTKFRAACKPDNPFHITVPIHNETQYTKSKGLKGSKELLSEGQLEGTLSNIDTSFNHSLHLLGDTVLCDTPTVRDIPVENIQLHNYDASVGYKSKNRSQHFNKEEENPIIYNKNQELKIEEKRGNIINIDVHRHWFDLSNRNSEEESKLDTRSTCNLNILNEIIQDKPALKHHLDVRNIKAVDETKQFDQIDKNSYLLWNRTVRELNNRLAILTDIENSVAEKKAQIIKQLNNLKHIPDDYFSSRNCVDKYLSHNVNLAANLTRQQLLSGYKAEIVENNLDLIFHDDYTLLGTLAESN